MNTGETPMSSTIRNDDGLALAAYLGHPTSALTLGTPVAARGEDAIEWARGLAPFGREVALRAALTAAVAAIDVIDRDGPGARWSREALAAAGRVLACACARHV